MRRPENLLLDEPTNHLDAKTRDWLASELKEYPGTVVVVTHDGEFLDRVVTRVLDLRDGQVEAYAGTYSDYQRQKADRLQAQDRAAARQERELAKQERFIERFRAKASKTTQVQSREKQLAKVERIERTRKESEVHIELNAHGRTERDVLFLRSISHAYDPGPLVRHQRRHVRSIDRVLGDLDSGPQRDADPPPIDADQRDLGHLLALWHRDGVGQRGQDAHLAAWERLDPEPIEASWVPRSATQE